MLNVCQLKMEKQTMLIFALYNTTPFYCIISSFVYGYTLNDYFIVAVKFGQFLALTWKCRDVCRIVFNFTPSVKAQQSFLVLVHSFLMRFDGSISEIRKIFMRITLTQTRIKNLINMVFLCPSTVALCLTTHPHDHKIHDHPHQWLVLVGPTRSQSWPTSVHKLLKIVLVWKKEGCDFSTSLS